MDYSKLKVKFDWTGFGHELITDPLKESLESMYVAYYNVFCDITNKLLPVWNKQWDIGHETYQAEGFEYITWMQRNYKTVLTKDFDNMIYDFDIGNECQFIGKLKQIRGIELTFHLEEG